MDQPESLPEPPLPSLTPAEVRYWAEFTCWTMTVMAPIFIWINGPSVSPDQFVVRTATFCLALTGALGLRSYKMIRARRKQQDSEGSKA